MNQVKTQVESITDILDGEANGMIKFIIPSYQRPYVWPAMDVEKLLQDIESACIDESPHYYIGTITSSKKDGNGLKIYELIDGQQRITTLMLIAIAFTRKLPEHNLSKFPKSSDKPRLTFKIRENVTHYLQNQINDPNYQLTEKERKDASFRYVEGLENALKRASDWLDALDKFNQEKAQNTRPTLTKLADYIYRHVKWVNNTMPPSMDLNQLFTRINTTGIQLEQSDLLKVKLLKSIPSSDGKAVYDAIWQSCENMGDYFERNVRSLFKKSDWHHIDESDFAKFCSEKFVLGDVSGNHGVIEGKANTIADIVGNNDGNNNVVEQGKQSNEEPDDVKTKVRSIISFALLLMHTYRIYLAQKTIQDISSRLKVEQFSVCFNDFPENEDEAKKFIALLWQVRYQFDRWVVKWMEIEGETDQQLRLTSVEKATYKTKQAGDQRYFKRSEPEPVSDIVQLQAVRYFTGEHSAQYWLTPLLGWLVKQTENLSKKDELVRVLAQLEKIDNDLSLSTTTQKEASFALLKNEKVGKQSIDDICAYLNSSKGTGFEHYWFQKLEYILWKHPADFLKLNEKLKRYRITSKNSVEHIHPQQHNEPTKQLNDEDVLNSFGNLALLSAGQNSSYSNKSVGEKRGQFNDKGHYDSLKLAHIFNTISKEDDWNKDAIAQHQKAMIQMIADYYGGNESLSTEGCHT